MLCTIIDCKLGGKRHKDGNETYYLNAEYSSTPLENIQMKHKNKLFIYPDNQGPNSNDEFRDAINY